MKENYKFLIPFFLFIIYFSPFIIKGTDVFIESHDNLDMSNMSGIYNESFEGRFFKSKNFIDFSMPGVSQLFKLDIICFNRLLFYFFGYFYGYIINEILIHLIAYIGMLLFVNVIKNNQKFPYLFQALTAFCFASLPFWSPGNLSVAGLPLLFVVLFNIYSQKKVGFSFLYLIIFPFYSSLFLSGIFIGILIVFIFFYLIKKNKLNKHIFFAILILFLGYTISHYNIFLVVLNNIPTNRELFSQIISAKNHSALEKFIELITKNQSHAPTNHYLIMFPTILVVIFEDFKSSKRKSLILLISIFIIMTSIIYGLMFYTPFINIIGDQGFNWSRFYFLNPFMWYALWCIILFELYNRCQINMKFLYTVLIFFIINGSSQQLGLSSSIMFILCVFISIMFYFSQKLTFFKSRNRLVIAVLLILQISLNTYSYTYSSLTGSPTFREFYSSQQFQEIIEKTNLNKETNRIGCIGFFPSVANFNGLKSIGAYTNFYPLEFHKDFYEIIKKEISQDSTLYNYFTKWGNRVYLFDNDLELKYYANQIFFKKFNPQIKSDLNMDILRKFGVTHIFSVSEIINDKQKGINLIYLSEDPNYYYRLYVYKI